VDSGSEAGRTVLTGQVGKQWRALAALAARTIREIDAERMMMPHAAALANH
jgi:hypothetical protein